MHLQPLRRELSGQESPGQEPRKIVQDPAYQVHRWAHRPLLKLPLTASAPRTEDRTQVLQVRRAGSFERPRRERHLHDAFGLASDSDLVTLPERVWRR